MLDILVSPKFNNSNEKYFKDYRNWVFLWECSIAMAVINVLREDGFSFNISRKIVGDNICQCMELDFKRPSEYFSYLINLDRKDLNDIFEKSALIIDLIRNIHSSVCVFIDKIDQALSTQTEQIVGQSKMSTGPRNASFWQYGQLSLLETAYNINAINPHIKIFFSIRKEALVDAEKICKVYQNTIEFFVNLDYEEYDLKKCLNNILNLKLMKT